MPTPSSRPYGTLPTGEPVEAWTLATASGAALEIITYGGIVTSLRMPDRTGRLDDVVLGFSRLDDYVARNPFFGAITGRIAGRVTGGRITIAGREIILALNDHPNHSHGGRVGLDKRLWAASPLSRADGAASLRLTYRSRDGEEGYPGNLDLAVIYTLSSANEFIIETEAASDRITPLSLTHHSYFNLAGEGSGPVADHELQIFADAFVPVDAQLTLSGRRKSVAGHDCDLRVPRRLGDALPRLFRVHGDLYHLRESGAPAPATPTLAARVVEPHSGRVLDVFTDESCLQFYSASRLDGSRTGKSGRAYSPHAGLCLECEGYPDGTNHPEFGDIFVRPGQPQRRRTIYAFSTR